MASTTATAGGAQRVSARVHVQKFGTFLSNMVMPNIGAFIAWGLITALFIESGWVNSIAHHHLSGSGPIAHLGGWGAYAATGGLVKPMITYLLPVLIGYTGGKNIYDTRGGVVGAIATMGVITGTDIPMFLGAMIMGPLGGWSMKKLDALWTHKIRPGFEMLVNNFSAGIWGGILAAFGFFVVGRLVEWFSTGAGHAVKFLVDHSLLPLTSILIEPAKILFLNNAINHGILTPLGTNQAVQSGKSVLFLLEANPGPGLGVLLAFTFFGRGAAKASAPGAAIIHFFGGIHEIYFPYVLMKPKLLAAVILGGMGGVFTNVLFHSGLRAPAAPGSIIAILLETPGDSIIGVCLSVIVACAISFGVSMLLLKTDRSDDDGDLTAATAQMEANKGKKSSVAGTLTGGGAGAVAADGHQGPIHKIVFACDAGMGSSAMGASVLRRKVQAAGHKDVTVVNKAISTLTDEWDLVVTHQDLTDRARERTGHAVHVSVDNFMNSPRYDEIVDLLDRTNGDGAGAAAPAAPVAATGSGATTSERIVPAAAAAGTATVVHEDAHREPTADTLSAPAEESGDAGVLGLEGIDLHGRSGDRDGAIDEAGALLVKQGACDDRYVRSMHDRETSVSTYMGNLLAIPHGTNEAKASIRRTGMSFVRYDKPISWNGQDVKFVVGIAGAGDDHLSLLAKLAQVFLDEQQVARLEAATRPEEVREILASVQA